jgi:hypothetical protein
MKNLFVFILLFLLLFFGVRGNIVFADNAANSGPSTISAESVNPGDDYRYIIKRLQEKITLFILGFSSQKKADYYVKLTAVRLSELKHVVDKKDIANIQTTSQRYAAVSGELTTFILDKNLTSYKQKVVDVMSAHIPNLEKLRDTYPYSSSEYRFVQDDINSLKSHISQLLAKK